MKKVSLIFLTFMLLGFVVKAQTKHNLGEKFGGGVVISVSADGLTGVIAETQDQGLCVWDEINALIANPVNHSKEGKAFNNWRLPSREELALMYTKKTTIAALKGNYWSSTTGKGRVSTQDFATGKVSILTKTEKNSIRSVRTF
ncbi:MAG: DUF1566 domain-containing protein [Paludibacter sp.]|nr:DUF1566 domain-containing protein [Paludibacter sp.]